MNSNYEVKELESQKVIQKNPYKQNVYNESALSSFYAVKNDKGNQKVNDKKFYESDNFFNKENNQNFNSNSIKTDQLLSSNENFFPNQIKDTSPEKSINRNHQQRNSLSLSDSNPRLNSESENEYINNYPNRKQIFKQNYNQDNINERGNFTNKSENAEFSKSATFKSISNKENDYESERKPFYENQDSSNRNREKNTMITQDSKKNINNTISNNDSNRTNQIKKGQDENPVIYYKNQVSDMDVNYKRNINNKNQGSNIGNQNQQSREGTFRDNDNKSNIQSESIGFSSSRKNENQNLPTSERHDDGIKNDHNDSYKNKIEYEKSGTINQNYEESKRNDTFNNKMTQSEREQTIKVNKENREITHKINESKVRVGSLKNRLNYINSNKPEIKSKKVNNYEEQKVFLGDFMNKCLKDSLYLYKNNNCHTCSKLLSQGKSRKDCPKNH